MFPADALKCIKTLVEFLPGKGGHKTYSKPGPVFTHCRIYNRVNKNIPFLQVKSYWESLVIRYVYRNDRGLAAVNVEA